MMYRFSISLILVVLCSLYAKAQYTSSKDSVLTVLMVQLKSQHPELIYTSEQTEYQSYSYIGHIVNDDSVLIYKVMTVQAKLNSNGTTIKKIVIFAKDKCLGFYDAPENFPFPKRILNHKYLIFDYKLEGQPKKVKINLRMGIPDSISIEELSVPFQKTS